MEYVRLCSVDQLHEYQLIANAQTESLSLRALVYCC